MEFSNIINEKFPVFLAPMAGITDAAFRGIVCSFGATAVVSEMISSEALVRNSKKTFRRIINKNGDFINIIQIAGANPINMAESAKINEDFGADVIDINMGCPARKIVANKSGSALMKDEDLAVKIAESIVNTVKIPVILKMRLGWDNEHINCLNLAKKFENVGIQMLAIHCRTRNQMYSGNANWSAISELKNIIKIPYLCNGDIKNTEDAKKAMANSNANGVMIGRAALGKPWLINQIMNELQGKIINIPSLKEQYIIIMEHFDKTLTFYGESHGIKFFRKHFCWYSSGLKGATAFREKINKIEQLNDVKNTVKDFYNQQFQCIL